MFLLIKEHHTDDYNRSYQKVIDTFKDQKEAFKKLRNVIKSPENTYKIKEINKHEKSFYVIFKDTFEEYLLHQYNSKFDILNTGFKNKTEALTYIKGYLDKTYEEYGNDITTEYETLENIELTYLDSDDNIEKIEIIHLQKIN